MRRSVWVLTGTILLLVLAVWMPQATAQTAADYDLPGIGHFYTQTNGGAGPNFGYRITNEGGIGFWNEYQRLGGVNALGYPASRRFLLDGFFVQATQKVIMQWRPDTNPPQVYFVNVFDKLHDMGRDSALQSTFQIPAQLDPGFDAGKTPDQIQAARLALLNGDAEIASRFGTGPAAILYNGLPTSTITNAGPFLIIRAQRIAIQKWTAAGPGGITPGTVSVVNGGDVAKTMGLVPGDAAITEDSAGRASATPTPPAPTATPVPQFPYLSKGINDAPVKCSPNPPDVPCIDSGPNPGIQYIKGHVMDKNGNGISGLTVRMTFYGNQVDVGTEFDGAFTLTLSTNCPIEQRIYNLFIVDSSGKQSSDSKQIVYNNCNNAGEFHFDFVRQS